MSQAACPTQSQSLHTTTIPLALSLHPYPPHHHYHHRQECTVPYPDLPTPAQCGYFLYAVTVQYAVAECFECCSLSDSQ